MEDQTETEMTKVVIEHECFSDDENEEGSEKEKAQQVISSDTPDILESF